jgi:hypothetical protein
MKSLLTLLSIAVAVLASARVADADTIDWADDVEAYSSKIQNYGGTMMDASTTWWLTGPPDGDDTHDYVGGWKSNAPNEYIVMHWETAIPDLPGDDLVIHLYGGPSAEANVLASVGGSTFTNIGTIGGGVPLVFRQESFDFDGQFAGDVSYVKVERVTNGPQTGMFFDAFGGVAVPEPGAMALLLTAAGFLAVWWRRRS